MQVVMNPLREAVLRILDELPPERVSELLDFALFLKHRSQFGEKILKAQLKTVPAAHLEGLTGLVAWGGDSLTDVEGLYEI